MVQLAFFAPALRGCALRLQRAHGYIQEADAILDAYALQAEQKIAASYDTDTGRYKPLYFPPVPEILPLALSDAINNLRCALDYLVFELARKDSGAIQKGTQFPIETFKLHTSPNGNKIGFDTVTDRYLRGVNQGHQDAIELLQPYNGVKWTALLRDLSNSDKHRELIPVTSEDFLSIWTRPKGDGTPLPTGQHIKVDPHQTIKVETPQGLAFVMHTLETLYASVGSTITSFNSEF